MEPMLAGRHALVTGAARGIGAAIARMLVAEGARVTLLGRTRETLEALRGGLAGDTQAIVADVGEFDTVGAAFAEARMRFGPISILVNNAGQAETVPVAKMPLAHWQRMLDVNLTGTFVCTQAALPDMLAAKAGRIVNIASTAALQGYPYAAAYAAAKHGVLGFTRSLAVEVAQQGITVNAVCPGYTETDLVREGVDRVVARTGRTAEEVRATFAARNPQNRLVQPEEVADAVRWLCGEGARGVNGAAVPISGGEVT